MVELAIALPMLAWLACGLFDLGRVAYYGVTVTDAARDVARVLVSNDAGYGPGVAAGCSMAQAAVVDASASPSCPSTSTQPSAGQVLVVISCPDNNVCAGDPSGSTHGQPVTVDVYYGFRFITPLLSSIAPGGIVPVHARAVMNASW